MSCDGNHFCFAFDFGMSWVRWLWRLIVEKMSTAPINSVVVPCPGDLVNADSRPRSLLHDLVYYKSFSQVPHSALIVLLYSKRMMGISLCGKWREDLPPCKYQWLRHHRMWVASQLLYTSVCSAFFQASPCALWKELLGQQPLPLLIVLVIILNEFGDL